ncbi:MAG TPA: DUF559 domain-containing protein [Mycobacteriales bacterium]|nr:DUF559 domain-containing protein [Mycobacteriales bacterium]
MPRRTPVTTGQARALARHLEAHHQVVDRATLLTLGFPADHGRNQVDAGRWQRVHRGVYCAYTGPLTFLARCEAAIRAVGHGAVIDGAAALCVNRHQGYDGTGPIDVAVRHGAPRPRLTGVRVRQTDALTPRSWWTRSNLPVLRPEWAAVAVARRAPLRARGALAAAVQQGHVLPAHLFAVILATGRFRGRPRLEAIVRDLDGGSRSELEAIFIELCRRAGVVLPEQNYAVRVGDRRAWLDACWPDLRLAVEIDGKAYHVLSEDWEQDLVRQNDLVLGGWTVLRFTAAALREHPDEVIATLRAALAPGAVRRAG